MTAGDERLKSFLDDREVDASVSIWEKLRKGKQTHNDIPWPGRPDVTVRMRVLTSSEEQEAVARAYKRFIELELPISPLTVEEYAAEEITQRLAMTLRDPSSEELVFEDGDKLRDIATTAERHSLFTAYEAMAADAVPDFLTLSMDEYETISDAVKKKDATLLSSCGLRALVTYLVTTDSLQSNLPTDSSTPGA